MKPRARRLGVVVQEVADETVVYDLERHEVHCLNPTAAAVWRLCDGRHDFAALARALPAKAGLPDDVEIVRLAVAELGRARLLEDPALREAASPSRRRLLLRLGAAALPAIVTIASPTALQAATCRLTQPISPSDCNNNRPGAAGCCCGNNKICSAPGTSNGCSGARC